MSVDSGKVFDQTADYLQENQEIDKFLDYFFTKEEIEGKKILDAGSRVGDYVLAFQRKGAGTAVGVDLSQECVDIAQKRGEKVDTIDFHQADITDLSIFADNSFDLLICVGTIIYLPPAKMEIALKEFHRVVRNEGTILVLFQKKKGFLLRTVRWWANALPFGFYNFLVKIFARLASPIVSKFAGRKVNAATTKYLLLGLRGIHFGVPNSISEEFRIETPTCEQCSETSSASYKIKVKKS